ncbi:MAG: hypothetical protein CSB34_00045 [Desulfobulbus propionicus]|nr:MAG: hypothetical protein CSB34_00045 [Desulfobulbus propionicus]
MLKICCVCSKIEHEGQWFAGSVHQDAKHCSHGYCPDCLEDIMTETEQYFRGYTRGVEASSWMQRVPV